MDEIIRNRKPDIKLSLHDAHITGIKIENDSLKFKFNYIYDYSGKEEKQRKANIIFKEVDLDFCRITLLKEKGKKVTGKAYMLEEYVKKHKHIDLEIISETYTGYDTIWTGYSYGKKMREFFIELWNHGDMIYKVW